ncbi:uncharacterized protein At1g76070 [Rutidosis leptorrhynchoides]|uniref:uncharacterized protein At1g76070 n=1 Tax=Rutidosis leptorrhynchoides TaxID=125765 RepID=UPI003A99665E
MDQPKTSTTKSKNTIMKFLPKATSSVSFQNPPIYSPMKDKRSSDKTHKSNLGIGFSGPLVSMIPADTRRKIKNKSDYAIVYEPTSPRVSCMGQVKCKYQKDKHLRGDNKPPNVVKHSDKVLRITSNVEDDHEETSKTDKKSKKKLGFKQMFSSITTPSGKKRHDVGNNKDIINKAPLYLDKAPSLSMMKRFSSGRGKFSSVDWTKEIEAIDSDIRRNCLDEESDDERVIMPSSAPVIIRNSLGFDDKFIRVAGINKEPKKEINLWKRRTMSQPKPLQID